MSRAPRRRARGGTRVGPPPRYGRRGYWGYMGSSPVGMHPSSPPRRSASPTESIDDIVLAAAMGDPDDMATPLINTSRESRLDFTGLLNRTVSRMDRAQSRAATPAPGGYMDDIFLSLSQEDHDKYECNICFHVVRDPRECSNKHLFCATCIHKWSVSVADNRSRCPVCRTFGRYRPSIATDSVLLGKLVKCVHNDCTWTGILRGYKTHVKSHDPPVVESESVHLPAICSVPHEAPAGFMDPELVERGLPGRDISDHAVTMSRAVTTQQRIQHGRQRIQNMLAEVRAEMDEHRRHVEQFQQEREQLRQESLMEVHSLGDQLGELAGGLVDLLGDIRVDSERCNDYIRALRRGDALPDIARRVAANSEQQPGRSNSSPRYLPPRLNHFERRGRGQTRRSVDPITSTSRDVNNRSLYRPTRASSHDDTTVRRRQPQHNDTN